MQKILYVEDDLSLIDGLQYTLESSGYAVDNARTVKEALSLFRSNHYDLLLLDVTLPDGTGFDVCKEVRSSSTIPIIFLTASDQEISIVKGLDMGGDDYITKPISLEVLVAKVQAMLRRSYDYETPPPEPRLRGAVLDAAGSCLMRGGERIPLTKNELGILQVLLERPGQVVCREAIMLRLWESDEFVDDNTLTVNVNRLRKTLAAAGIEDCVVTHKGQGYSINA